MRACPIALMLLAGISTGTCAKRVPEPKNVAPGAPHVSWVIMSGDRENPDQDFVCQSEPRNDCVISASRPDAQVFSAVYLYFHGVGSETRYEGPVNYGFFQGAGSHTFPVGITATGNESITNASVTGIVTSTPGSYAVTLSLSARVAGAGRTESIRDAIPVLVR